MTPSTPCRDQGGVHPLLDTLRGLAGNAQVLDAITQFIGIGHVLGLYPGNALGIGTFQLQRDAEGDGAQDGQFVGRIGPFHVKSRVGLGVAEVLGLAQGLIETAIAVAHPGQDVIAGTVDDTGHPFDLVGGQSFAQRLDDGDAAGHGSLERHHHPLVLGRLEDFIAVFGDQRLVGGHHMLVVVDGAQDQFQGRLVTTDEFNDDLHLWIIHYGKGVVGYLRDTVQAGDGSGVICLGRGVGDNDTPAGTARDLFGVTVQHGDGAAADGTEAQ